MNVFNNKPDFSNLLSALEAKILLQRLTTLTNNVNTSSTDSWSFKKDQYLEDVKSEWQRLSAIKGLDGTQSLVNKYEQAATDWLIQLFNNLFAHQNVTLVRGQGEPEYFPAQNNEPAKIEFAHGFFASALHELSHWCVAGEARRRLPDFGYWYAPDGRTAAQQQAFERVEIKPQALECLFTLACERSFEVSQDNLFADFDTSNSTFANDVYRQAQQYIAEPNILPRDAKTLLHALLSVSTSDTE